jgi:hypothetical protein
MQEHCVKSEAAASDHALHGTPPRRGLGAGDERIAIRVKALSPRPRGRHRQEYCVKSETAASDYSLHGKPSSRGPGAGACGFCHNGNKLSPLLVALLALTLAGAGLGSVHADGPNRVGLVVRLGDGSLTTRCVEFGGPEISGYDVLVRSGLNIVAAFDSGMGAAVCAIEGEGCPVEECLTCAQPNYWAYFHLKNGTWVYSPAGVSGYKVRNGDVEGWSWGTGDPPPVVPFDQICAPPPTDTPAPTDTPPPTETPIPPTATLPPATPTATSPPPAPMVWFRLDGNPIAAGTCTTVRWDTDNAQEIYLDGERVSADGSREVCPTTLQEYHLRVVSAAGEQTDTLVLGVTGAVPSPTATSQPAALPSPSPSPLPQPAPATSSPPSPTPEPGADPSPSPSPTAQPPPATSPSPSPTPERVALVSRARVEARAVQPTLAPSRSAGTASPARDSQGPSATLLGITTFNLLMIGLLSWLIVRILQRR